MRLWRAQNYDRQAAEMVQGGQACLEDVDYHQPRGLDRGQLRQLGTGEWIRAHHVALLSGPTGVGKSWLACALGNAACRQGFSTRYYRVPRLLSELKLAHADGSYPRLLTRLAKASAHPG